MADPDRGARLTTRAAQLLLVLAAVALWGASRLPWVRIRSFDGLGQPKTVTLSGALWSSALLPVAVVLLAAAVAVLAVRGWLLRVLAVLVAATSLATAYLAISLWVVRDVAVRGADLADVPVMSLAGGSQRHYAGAVITLAAAVVTLVAAVLLMRTAAAGTAATTKYAAPGARRSLARGDDADPGSSGMSERMLWDALDEGRDPTDPATGTAAPPGSDADTEGR